MASNIRPINDPTITQALEVAIASLQLLQMDRPVGMSACRFEIFRAIGASWPSLTMSALCWAAHASPAAVEENLDALRRLGLVDWGCIRLSDQGRALFEGLPRRTSAAMPDVFPEHPAPQAEPAQDRLSMIREAAKRRESQRQQAPRLPLVSTGKPVATSLADKPDWIANRHARVKSAIAFLQTKGVLVSVENRDALVRRYRMTPTYNVYTAEQVIGRAERMGWEGASQ